MNYSIRISVCGFKQVIQVRHTRLFSKALAGEEHAIAENTRANSELLTSLERGFALYKCLHSLEM